MRRKPILVLAIVVEAALAVVALVIGWWFGLPMGDWVRWSMAGLFWGLAGAAMLLGILGLCRRFPVGPVGRLIRLVDTTVTPVFRGCRVVDLLVISVLAGIGEEMLFRGAIQGGLAVWLVPWCGEATGLGVALGVAGILFGAAHCISREYAVFATGLGLVLGWMAIATGGLLAPMVAHAGYDFVALLLLTRLQDQ